LVLREELLDSFQASFFQMALISMKCYKFILFKKNASVSKKRQVVTPGGSNHPKSE
jgi:hypothetical protein